MSPATPTTKASENFLRRCVNEWTEGDWELRKSRVRDPNAHTYGKWAVYEPYAERWLTNGFSLDFEEAEEFFLRALAASVTNDFQLTLGELEDELAPKDVYGWLIDTLPLDHEYATRLLAIIAEESPDDDADDDDDDATSLLAAINEAMAGESPDDDADDDE